MKIYIDIGHPAYAHAFRHFIVEMKQRGLLFGESASMAAEAAVLGVPAIYIDNKGRGYTRELEKKHGLVFNFSEDDIDVERALDKAVGLLSRDDLREEWLRKRDKMLAGKVDLTSWMIDLADSPSFSPEGIIYNSTP